MLRIISLFVLYFVTISKISCQVPLGIEQLGRCTSSKINEAAGNIICAKANCSVQSINLPVDSDINTSSDLEWRITGVPDFRIIVQFVVYGVKSCCDFFQITEGDSLTFEELEGRLHVDPLFSHDPLILTYVSRTGSLFVRIPSNMTTNFDHVRASYQITEEFPYNYAAPSKPITQSHRTDCGGNISATLLVQNLSTPGWPSPNGIINNRNCLWTIMAEPGSRIELTFEEFRTEACCDYVEISEVGGNSERLSGNRRRPHRYISNNNVVNVRFISDANTKSTGFLLRYGVSTSLPRRNRQSSQELIPCQLISHATHLPQPLSSPGWPQPYFENLNCKWILNGKNNHRILIQVLTLDIGDQTLQFREAGSVLKEIKGRNVQTYITSANSVLLRFRTKKVREGIGFYATYQLTTLFPENATQLTATMRSRNHTDRVVEFQDKCETIINTTSTTTVSTTAQTEETTTTATTMTTTTEANDVTQTAPVDTETKASEVTHLNSITSSSSSKGEFETIEISATTSMQTNTTSSTTLVTMTTDETDSLAVESEDAIDASSFESTVGSITTNATETLDNNAPTTEITLTEENSMDLEEALGTSTDSDDGAMGIVTATTVIATEEPLIVDSTDSEKELLKSSAKTTKASSIATPSTMKSSSTTTSSTAIPSNETIDTFDDTTAESMIKATKPATRSTDSTVETFEIAQATEEMLEITTTQASASSTVEVAAVENIVSITTASNADTEDETEGTDSMEKEEYILNIESTAAALTVTEKSQLKTTTVFVNKESTTANEDNEENSSTTKKAEKLFQTVTSTESVEAYTEDFEFTNEAGGTKNEGTTALELMEEFGVITTTEKNKQTSTTAETSKLVATTNKNDETVNDEQSTIFFGTSPSSFEAATTKIRENIVIETLKETTASESTTMTATASVENLIETAEKSSTYSTTTERNLQTTSSEPETLKPITDKDEAAVDHRIEEFTSELLSTEVLPARSTTSAKNRILDSTKIVTSTKSVLENNELETTTTIIELNESPTNLVALNETTSQSNPTKTYNPTTLTAILTVNETASIETEADVLVTTEAFSKPTTTEFDEIPGESFPVTTASSGQLETRYPENVSTESTSATNQITKTTTKMVVSATSPNDPAIGSTELAPRMTEQTSQILHVVVTNMSERGDTTKETSTVSTPSSTEGARRKVQATNFVSSPTASFTTDMLPTATKSTTPATATASFEESSNQTKQGTTATRATTTRKSTTSSIRETPAAVIGNPTDDYSNIPINISSDHCFSQDFIVDGQTVRFEQTPIHELALSIKRCKSGRPYGVVRCTKSVILSSGRPMEYAKYDQESLYAVPCNVTLDHLASVAAGGVNSTLQILPSLMVLTSLPHTLEADNISAASDVLFQFYSKAKENMITYQELVSVTYTIGSIAGRIQDISNSNDRVPELMSDLLSSLHDYIGILPLEEDTSRVNVTTTTVDIQIAQSSSKNRRYNPIKFNFVNHQTKKKVSLRIPPSAIFSAARLQNKTKPVFFVTILNNRIRLDPTQNTSQIISVGLANSKKADIDVGITFEDHAVMDSITDTDNKFKRRLNKQKLVKWSYAEDDWNLANECELTQRSNHSTQFECPKFASYAILFSHTTIPSVVILTRVSYIGCLLSVGFLLATVLINTIPKKLRNKPTTPILINICFCLSMVYIFFVFGISSTANKTLCDAMTFLLHYFTLASLSWMTVNAYQMHRTFTSLFIDVKAPAIVVYLLAYGIPYLFVFINFSVTVWYLDLPYDPEDLCFESKYRAKFMCWLQPPSLYYGFLLPFGILLLFNYFVFVVLLRKVIFRKIKVRPSTRNGASKERQRRNQLLNTVTMVTMMGLTWIFGYFLLIAEDVTYQSIMQWLFIIFNVFQGIIIFYMNCLRLASVRALWLPCSKRPQQNSNGTTTVQRSKPSPTITRT